MREILFRGKRQDVSKGKDWVYGDFNQHDVHHGTSILECGCINHGVRHETVGQYTGLKDKNGKMIFEGDIVQACDGIMAKVYFDREIASFLADCSYLLKNHELTIVGNIQDNPELLESADA